MMAVGALRERAPASDDAPGDLRCILRMASGRTLSVAQSLSAAGFDVWAPSEVLQRRFPRSRKAVEQRAPILPTFAFARAEHITELLALSKSPVSEHPPFSLFRYLDCYPLIHDRSLGRLREIEERKNRRRALKQQCTYSVGDRVKANSGGFEGLRGTVDLTQGQFATVSFDGWNLPVKIASFLLLPDMP